MLRPGRRDTHRLAAGLLVHGRIRRRLPVRRVPVRRLLATGKVLAGILIPWLLLAGPLLLAPRATAQIVNTLAGFDDDAATWSGQLGARFSLSGGNTDVRALSGDAHVQWKQEGHRVRLLGGATRKSSGGTRTAESSMAHLRHNARLAPWLWTLTFVQIQHNPFQNLKTRLLVGAGLRFDLLRRDDADLAVGAAHMVEIEELESIADFDTDQRLSLFVAAHLELSPDVRLDATSFVQPLWARPSDLRATGALALRTRLTGPLHLTQEAALQYDAEPPDRVETTDWELETGLAYQF